MNRFYMGVFALYAFSAQAQVTPPAHASNEFRQSFNFSNTDLRSAFKALSTTGHVDIVVSPTVIGNIASLQLSEKTWQEALTIVCQMYSLKFSVEVNYLYIRTMDEFNKISMENANALQVSGALSPLVRDVINLRNAKAKDLYESVSGLLSTRGRLTVVERNNAFLVFDTRANILEIRAAVKELDVETYQVNIQAQLIQVDADALQDMGVDWQAALRNGSQPLHPTLGNPGKLPTTGSNNVLGTSSQVGIGGSSQSGGSGGGSGGSGASSGGDIIGGVAGATSVFAFGLLDGHIAVALANLLQTSKGEVVAKPQITTLDNSEARIFMGEQVPVRVLDANGRQAVKLEDAGTSLRVTPHVTADGRVLLDLNPEKNSFRRDQSDIILQKQSASTTVLVNDGETVVIAGLTTKEENEIETGVPLLKDIPILGWLFKHKSTQTRKRDLIIFVTPHVVRTGLKTSAAGPSVERPLGEGVYGDFKGGQSGGTRSAPSTPSAPVSTGNNNNDEGP